MKKIIIDRIEQFKLYEDNFKSKGWENKYVSFTLNNIFETKHISDVNFEILNDKDLVRIFEYIIICRSDISTTSGRITFDCNKVRFEEIVKYISTQNIK